MLAGFFIDILEKRHDLCIDQMDLFLQTEPILVIARFLVEHRERTFDVLAITSVLEVVMCDTDFLRCLATVRRATTARLHRNHLARRAFASTRTTRALARAIGGIGMLFRNSFISANRL